MTDTRRGGRERRGTGTQGRAGTRLQVGGEVVEADVDENPKRRAQGQRQGREEMGRRSTGAQAGAEGATGQRDAGRIVDTASSVGQNEKQTGCSSGMGYCDGAEHKVVTIENSRGWRGATDGQTTPIFRRVGGRVLADGAQNAFSERLLGRAGGSAGEHESGAAEPRLGGAPVD